MDSPIKSDGWGISKFIFHVFFMMNKTLRAPKSQQGPLPQEDAWISALHVIYHSDPTFFLKGFHFYKTISAPFIFC